MNTFVSLLSSIELCLLACLRKQTQFDKISNMESNISKVESQVEKFESKFDEIKKLLTSLVENQ